MSGITNEMFEHFENGQRALLRDGDGVGTRNRMILFPDQNLGFFISYNSGDSNLRLNVLSAFLDKYYPATGSTTPIPMDGYQKRARGLKGTYRYLQADATTFGKSMFFFSQLVEVTTTDEGYLSIVTRGMGAAIKAVLWAVLREPACGWRSNRCTSSEWTAKVNWRSSRTSSGCIIQMISGQGYHATFEKLPWYEAPTFQTVLIALAYSLCLRC